MTHPLVEQVCQWVRIDDAWISEARKERVLTQANIAISNAERVERKAKARAGL